MNFLNKMERKFGRYAIPELTKYIILCYVIGYALEVFARPCALRQRHLLDGLCLCDGAGHTVQNEAVCTVSLGQAVLLHIFRVLAFAVLRVPDVHTPIFSFQAENWVMS